KLVGAGETGGVWARPAGQGKLQGVGYAGDPGVESNTINSDPQAGVTIAFSSQPSNGILRVSLTMPNGSASMILAINKVGGKYVGYAIGTDQQSSLYNICLIEQ